jgi:citrate synthase
MDPFSPVVTHVSAPPSVCSPAVYPNVDFYSGLIYKAMGFPTDYFPVLFLIPRTVGWLAHWSEFTDDPENRIVRPFQVYVGSGKRDYAGVEGREKSDGVKAQIRSEATAESRRRDAAKSDTHYPSSKL